MSKRYPTTLAGFGERTRLLGEPFSKNAVMGTSKARASCCKVATLGELLSFSMRLRVFTANPLFWANARMDKPCLARSARSANPTSTSLFDSGSFDGAVFALAGGQPHRLVPPLRVFVGAWLSIKSDPIVLLTNN